MSVLVDTSVLSLAFRRKFTSPEDELIVSELGRLIQDLQMVIIGPIRQEILSGIRDSNQFFHLRQNLRSFEDGLLSTHHFELAADYSNKLRAKGIQSSEVDALICAYATAENIPIFTTDQDFTLYSRVIPIQLHQLPDIG
jgi:predicted nucleic acid-binding protein